MAGIDAVEVAVHVQHGGNARILKLLTAAAAHAQNEFHELEFPNT